MAGVRTEGTSDQLGEEGGEVVGEQFWFLAGGEVSSAAHGGVAGEVVGPLDPFAGWPAFEVVGEDRDRGRYLDAFAARGESLGPLVVGPERRRDRVGEPVQRRLGQEEVVAEPAG